MIELKLVRTRESVQIPGRSDNVWSRVHGYDLRWDGGVVYITKGDAQCIVPLSNVACMEPLAVGMELEKTPAAGASLPVKRGPGRPPKAA